MISIPQQSTQLLSVSSATALQQVVLDPVLSNDINSAATDYCCMSTLTSYSSACPLPGNGNASVLEKGHPIQLPSGLLTRKKKGNSGGRHVRISKWGGNVGVHHFSTEFFEYESCLHAQRYDMDTDTERAQIASFLQQTYLYVPCTIQMPKELTDTVGVNFHDTLEVKLRFVFRSYRKNLKLGRKTAQQGTMGHLHARVRMLGK